MDEDELDRIHSLIANGHLPITSKEVLATMLGVNPGIIWSLINRPGRHYRRFSIPKGQQQREILAPKIGLKIIQKWISVQLQNRVSFPDHVYGFVPGYSHVDAASQHTNARWLYSIDLENFFPSTPKNWVCTSLAMLGYDLNTASLIASLCCYGGALAQGAPSSPVLSNVAMSGIDGSLNKLASELGIRVTRYADDITFSSDKEFPSELPERLSGLFEDTPWKISTKKTHFAEAPARLKVHGLIVNDNQVKLTKGYRNKLRAYRQVIETGKCRQEDVAHLSGHLNYAAQVEQRNATRKLQEGGD